MLIGGNTNVLIVDDFATARRFILMSLKDLGITKYAEAENAENAYALMQEERFDLVLLDWNMPGKSGLALLKQIRTTPALRTTPVVLMLMEELDEYIAQGHKLGMSTFIVKPFDSTTLSRTLSTI